MSITLKAARINKQIKQKDAAMALKIAPDTLRSWELGNTFPDAFQIKEIEKLYGISYSEINFCPKVSV